MNETFGPTTVNFGHLCDSLPAHAFIGAVLMNTSGGLQCYSTLSSFISKAGDNVAAVL